jgi:hypothetical protein
MAAQITSTVTPLEGETWNDLHCYGCGHGWNEETMRLKRIANAPGGTVEDDHRLNESSLSEHPVDCM